ncbi:hypothetical protein GF326_06800 [Candidatus Bathyarchaeota archaeon]|nr:hypothetical protein [Candidatus Bathyarchaeota archaeon]
MGTSIPEQDRGGTIHGASGEIRGHGSPRSPGHQPRRFLPDHGDGSWRNFIAYEALAESGLDCVFDNMMGGSSFINTKHGWD